MHILGWIVFGAFIGWIANAVMGKRGGGCLVNIALGLVGALGGGFLFQQISGNFNYDQHGLIVSTLVAVIGAIIVLAIWNLLTGHRPLR
ncbi:MAG TPA: GlsB/YeaQ/YmgE family stress response membrane protein [Rhizomicrobium sp.]|nr:GlsB/YeaQ/YmgE family stress response membrane protein [Rhizomicrobium sp.]